MQVKNLEAHEIATCRGSTAWENVRWLESLGATDVTHRLRFQTARGLSEGAYVTSVKTYAANHCADGVKRHKLEMGPNGIVAFEVSLVWHRRDARDRE